MKHNLPKTLLKLACQPLGKAILSTASLFVMFSAHAGAIATPNFSFESPVVVPGYIASPDMDEWQKNPQPFWYDPSMFNFYPWSYLAGEFYNDTNVGNFIDNMEGNQAAYIQALPNVGIFQDYNSIYGTNTLPTHNFNATYTPGKAYKLTVGVVGAATSLNYSATLLLSLYYRDAQSNMVTVASTTVTNDPAIFTNHTHLFDFSVFVPQVQAGDAWAGKKIGIAINSTVDFTNYGGYWDVDNVRLTESISVPNFSFESPVVVPGYIASPDMDEWQKNPQPYWYDPSMFNFYPWSYLAGEFYNDTNVGNFIDNMEGNQAAYIQALPNVGIFQDYNSIYGTNTLPTHDFNAIYTPGKAYKLTVGVVGAATSLNYSATLLLSLYYRDAQSNMVSVASTTVTNDPAIFTNHTHLFDFSVQIPLVKSSDPWAGRNIGVAINSTVDFSNYGGYWDVDNARLIETTATLLGGAGKSAGQFNFNLISEPGLAFQILATTNLSAGSNSWVTLGMVTNSTGFTNLVDSATNLNQRFYRLRQM